MSEEALRRIAENRQSQSPALDLSGCELETLPVELAALTWLESLNLGETKISDLSPLARLTLLKRLDLGDTLVNDLDPLSALTELRWLNATRSRVADLRAMSNLPKLAILYVMNTAITDLAPLAQVASLQHLLIQGTAVADLSPLARLETLEFLDLSGTRVNDLGPLRRLMNLDNLYCRYLSLLRDLEPLSGCLNLTKLDVGSTGVESLAPLAALGRLVMLDISQTAVHDLGPISGLSTLARLSLARSRVSKLAALRELHNLAGLDLDHTPVDDITPLRGLRSLATLNLSDTAVTDLSPLQDLPALRSLGLANATPAMVRQLKGLAKLSSLNLMRLASPPPVVEARPEAVPETTGLERTVGDFKSLQDLVSPPPAAAPTATLATPAAPEPPLDLSPLTEMTALTDLNLSHQPVHDLSPLRALIEAGLAVKVSDTWWERVGIYVGGCPLSNPPIEVAAQGNAAILNYFNEREAGVDHLYEAKLLILGEGGAGKTSLLRRLYQPDQPLPGEQETTRGINIHRHDFDLPNGRRFRLNVWDFGGQEIYHATHQFFLTRRSLYVLVDDTRKDHKTVSDEGFKYWLDLVDVFGGHSPLLVFQNEKGGRSKEIDLAGIKGRFANVLGRYAGNLELPGAAGPLREAIEWHAAHLSHIGEELPARWVRVRAEIEAVAQQQPYISQQAYFDLYASQLPFDRSKALHLSRYLHDLGVFLHFQGDEGGEGDDGLLSRTVILRNSWATEAVFRVLDDEAIKARRGRFSRADCQRLWHDPGYADKQPELLALMQRFELCYELPDSKPATWLAPQLLAASQPAALVGWAQPSDLVLRYAYSFMPKGLISRLTVRLHRLVTDADQAWITGVLLAREGAQVLVQRLPQGGEIELRARGVDRKALLSVVAGELDALNQSFAGLGDKVDKRIPCVCSQCRLAEPPWFFGQRALLRRREARQLQVQCETSFESVSVLELLDGIGGAELPGLREGTRHDSGLPLRELKVFLASSSELADERDAFDLHFQRHNDELARQGLKLKIIRWEHFLDAMSETGKQDDYNRAVADCDIFVSLFFRKAGQYTVAEFKVAHDQFKARGKPVVYTYFKDAEVSTGSIGTEFRGLLDFKDQLRALKHYPTSYTSAADLHLKFRDQITALLRTGAGPA